MKKPSSRSKYTPPRRIALDQMTPDELRAWIQRTRDAPTRKMQRERSYLDRRAARGTFTPTDEAYEQDQLRLALEKRSIGVTHAS